MKLTVVVFFCLIGIAIALHGTGGYGNGGGKPGKDISSSSEEDKSKKCKLTCTNNVIIPVILDRVPTLHDCNSGNALGNALQCNSCCQDWGLQRGLEKDDVISHVDGEDHTCIGGLEKKFFVTFFLHSGAMASRGSSTLFWE